MFLDEGKKLVASQGHFKRKTYILQETYCTLIYNFMVLFLVRSRDTSICIASVDLSILVYGLIYACFSLSYFYASLNGFRNYIIVFSYDNTLRLYLGRSSIHRWSICLACRTTLWLTEHWRK